MSRRARFIELWSTFWNLSEFMHAIICASEYDRFGRGHTVRALDVVASCGLQKRSVSNSLAVCSEPILKHYIVSTKLQETEGMGIEKMHTTVILRQVNEL